MHPYASMYVYMRMGFVQYRVSLSNVAGCGEAIFVDFNNLINIVGIENCLA